MKKTLIFLAEIIVLLAMFSVCVYAHPGRTDSNGGHYDNKNGGYHYHHGYPAHSHVNGACPYDYDDKTTYSPSGNVKNTNESKGGTATGKDTKTPVWKNIVGVCAVVIFCSPLILSVLSFVYCKMILPVVEYIKKERK